MCYGNQSQCKVCIVDCQEGTMTDQPIQVNMSPIPRDSHHDTLSVTHLITMTAYCVCVRCESEVCFTRSGDVSVC